MNSEFQIKIENNNTRNESILVSELARSLQFIKAKDVKLLKEDPTTQDAGTVLSIIFGSTVLTAVAKGIFNWLQRNRTVEISITKPDSSLSIKCSSVDDLAKIEDLLNKHF